MANVPPVGNEKSNKFLWDFSKFMIIASLVCLVINLWPVHALPLMPPFFSWVSGQGHFTPWR